MTGNPCPSFGKTIDKFFSIFSIHTCSSSSLHPDSNRLRCPSTTLLKSNQAWVMRRVIGPLPPEQGQPPDDMIDHDRSTMAAWCQRGAHGPPVQNSITQLSCARKLLHTPTHTHTGRTYAHGDTLGGVHKHVNSPV